MDNKRTRTAEPRSIRWHLFQILLVTIIPVGLVAAGLFYLHWQAQERERERSQIESVRFLAAAVDNALESTVQRMTIFARLWASGQASDALMYSQAQAALAANPDWSTIVVFRADGSAVFRADAPFGTPLPAMKLFDLWQPVLREHRALVSDVFTSPTNGTKGAAIGVPVVRDGKATHVMIASLNLRWFDELLTSQGAGGIAGIFDRNWKFVARGTEGDQRRGGDPSPPLIEDMKRRPEGIGRYSSLNAMPVYTSWTPSRHGWWVAFATPSAPVDNAFWTHLSVFGLMWAAAVAAGIAFAWRKGRRIAGALVSLESRAEDLALGRPLSALAASRVSEMDHAFAALGKASEALQDAMHQRDASLEIEREARAAAEAASRAKDEFLAMLGHELRNPLAAITNAVAIVKSERHTREQLDFASGVIDRQSQHLKRLIDDLLDVGRVMTGKILLEREPLELSASARHVATTLETAGRLTQRRFELDAGPVWISGDQTRIEQILTNLLVNAAAYTQPGGRIHLRIAQENADAVIQVIDDGHGIEAPSLTRVFELFYQADATVDRSRGGLGIGLTLVQRLAELHGGWAQAQSAGRGKGATLTVRIPAIAAPAAAQPALAEARVGQPREILIVEDNADARHSLRVALELQGHRVLEAADGPAALDLLRRHAPSVAILDIGLPGMDGYRLAELARAEHRDLFLIALTGYGGAEDERRASAAGFDRHLTKPADADALSRAIQSARRPFRNISAIRA